MSEAAGEVKEKMPVRAGFRDKKKDPGFLVAKGSFDGATLEDRKKQEKEHVQKLANATFMALTNHGYANVRSIGRNAVYNTVKALAIASGYCKPKGVDLCFEVCFDEGNLGPMRNEKHVQEVTAICFKVKGFKDWVESQSNEGDKKREEK